MKKKVTQDDWCDEQEEMKHWKDVKVVSKLTTIKQNWPDTVELMPLVKILEDFNFAPSSQLQDDIDENDYQENYNCLSYFKYFNKTPREPDLKEAVEDLLQIFPSEEKDIMNVYERYKSEPSKAVTMIWTNSYWVPRLINFALIVDAGKQFKFNK